MQWSFLCHWRNARCIFWKPSVDAERTVEDETNLKRTGSLNNAPKYLKLAWKCIAWAWNTNTWLVETHVFWWSANTSADVFAAAQGRAFYNLMHKADVYERHWHLRVDKLTTIAYVKLQTFAPLSCECAHFCDVFQPGTTESQKRSIC